MITQEMARLVAYQAMMTGQLTAQTVQMLLRLWSPFRRWYDEDSVIAHAARSATTVETAQRQVRARQRTYMRFIYREMGIEFPRSELIDNALIETGVRIPGGVDIYPRIDVSPLDVWMRPAETFRYEVSKGLRDNEALLKSLERIETMAHTDVSLAKREEIDAIYRATPKVHGYRRVIHPELSEDGTSCGLCVVASNRVYNKGQLLPIHDKCNCETLPIAGDNDPGKELNQDDLNAIYEAAGGNSAANLLKTKVFFKDHGELGPIIAGAEGKGYERTTRRERKEMTPIENMQRQLRILENSLARLINRKSNGEPGLDQQIVWLRDRVSVLGRQVRAVERNSKR